MATSGGENVPEHSYTSGSPMLFLAPLSSHYRHLLLIEIVARCVSRVALSSEDLAIFGVVLLTIVSEIYSTFLLKGKDLGGISFSLRLAGCPSRFPCQLLKRPSSSLLFLPFKI